MRELHNNVEAVEALQPQSGSSDVDGSTVDLQGFEAVEFVVQHAGGSSGETIAFDLEESDNDSDWSAVDDADVLGSEYSKENPSAETFRMGYNGEKQYVRVVHTAATSSVTFAASGVKGKARHKPTA